MNKELNIDYSKTLPLETWSNGNLWKSGFILRTLPKEITGNTVDGLIPLQVFYDPSDGRILTNNLPPQIAKEYEGKSIFNEKNYVEPPQDFNPTPTEDPSEYSWDIGWSNE